MSASIALLKTKIPLFPVWPETVKLDGIKVRLKDSPLTPLMRRRVMKGFYETAERELVQGFIKPGDQVLELGASIGIVTCFLARQVANGGRVISIEANPKLKPHFQAQLALNGLQAEWVTALGCPLWQNPVPASLEQQSFQVSESNLSGRTTSKKSDEPSAAWRTAESICRDLAFEPTAVVVDVEGTEAVWTELPPHVPSSVRTVIAEFHPKLTGASIAGQAVQAILDEGFAVAGLRETVLAFVRK